MLKKMRWRFIAAAMSAFLAVILTLLCFVNIWNYQSVADQQDEILSRLLEVDRAAMELPEGQLIPPFDSMERFSKEVPYMIRFFSVYYDGSGAVTRVNQRYIASVSASDAVDYAGRALAGGREKGYDGGYRYLVKRTAHSTVVLFLNSEKELQAAESLLLITLAIAGICLAILFLLVVLFSHRAIAPYLRNLEVQKQFITNAGHELKTPLTAISASAEVLAMEDGENEWVRSIQTQTGRLSRLVTDLVTLSRLNEEDPFPLRAEFSLSEALWELTEPFVPLAQARDRHFTQQIEEGLRLCGDRAAIQQMVSVLLDNALKYSPRGSDIRFSARRGGRHLLLEVENTATEKLDVSRLFDRFYRADESHSGAVGGTGIGLSIARATAEAHGGSISAVQEGERILFRVRL